MLGKPNPDDPLAIRRRMAKISFMTLLGTLGLILWIVLSGDQDTAKNLTAATGVLSTILVCFTGLVAGYGVAASIEKVKK